MKEISDKEQNTIKDIVKRVFGYDLEEVEFNGDKLRIVVEGKAYGDGYSSYVRAKYKDGVWQGSQIGGNSDLSSINALEKILHDLDVMINDVKSHYRQCGAFECGEE